MKEETRLVLDIGKTTAKVSAWTADGRCLARFAHDNRTDGQGDYAALDVAGIDQWLETALRSCAEIGRPVSIIPVGHGAAAAILRDDALALPIMDYEFAIPQAIADAYSAERDEAAITGSPRMEWGLNLGSQLYFLKLRHPGLFDDPTRIVPWAQFWAWRLSGTAACEVSSFGAHTDLWTPALNRPSPLADRLGFSALFAPMVDAGAVIGTLSHEWQQRSGLAADVAIHAGLHDSNAALHAARGRPRFAAGDATMLSTGTWFVTMRAPDRVAGLDLAAFVAGPGCLVNIDIASRPVPTALFMGGREFAELARDGDLDFGDPAFAGELASAARACVARGTMALPCWQSGSGFYPLRAGGWTVPPDGAAERAAASLLYLALMADRALELVEARRLLVIDGRFANIPLLPAALAALRPDLEVVVANAENDVALGALRAADPSFPIGQELTAIAPLDLDLTDYRARWRALAAD